MSKLCFSCYLSILYFIYKANSDLCISCVFINQLSVCMAVTSWVAAVEGCLLSRVPLDKQTADV